MKPLRGQKPGRLGDVFAANGQLFRGLNSHFDAAAGPAQKRYLNRAVGEQLRHGHIGVSAIRGLYDYRLIGATAQD
jgi:hypothetical protein